MNKSITANLTAAKIELTNALNKIISDSKLPSQLYENVLFEMLLEIEQQKVVELTVENMQLYDHIDKAEKQIEDYKQKAEKQEVQIENK